MEISGETRISTVMNGLVAIKELALTQEPFLVYCWDFAISDYAIDWASTPVKVGKSESIRIVLDNGYKFFVSPNQQILRRREEWAYASDLKRREELMPFYRVRADTKLNKLRTGQFPRIFTFNDSWKTERRFIDEWRKGKKDPMHDERVVKPIKCLVGGLTTMQMESRCGHLRCEIRSWLGKEGFTLNELRELGRKEDRRRIIDVRPFVEKDMYSMTISEHESVCIKSCVLQAESE